MEIIHVVDFEGTRKNGISEFGVVTLKDFEIFDTKSEYCQNSFNEFLDYFISIRKIGLFAAHSAQTEDNLLRKYWASPGKVPAFVDDGTKLSWGPWVDTKLIYRKLFRGLVSYELRDLICSFSLDGQLMELSKLYCNSNCIGFHNSLFDALAAALLLQNIKNFYANVSCLNLVSTF